MVNEIHFHHGNPFAAPTKEFVANVPCSREEVESGFVIKIVPVFKNVEQCFFGNVSRGPRSEGLICPENSSTVYSAYNSHGFNLV